MEGRLIITELLNNKKGRGLGLIFEEISSIVQNPVDRITEPVYNIRFSQSQLTNDRLIN